MNDEERWVNYYKLPKIILEMMEWLCETRFYKKTYEKNKNWYEDVNEKWKFCDFNIEVGTLENPKIIKIGQIPHYQYDTEKSLYINFKDKEDCHLVRGYATTPYAGKIISTDYKIPKYMKDDLYAFIDKLNIENEK